MTDVVCYAPGDNCFGCDHYHGKADRCEYAGQPNGSKTESHLKLLLGAARAVCDDADYDDERDVCLVSVSPLEHLQNVIDHIRIFSDSEGQKS